MKPYRPKSTWTKIYEISLVQLREIKKKLNKDGIVVLAELIDKEHKALFKDKK